MGQTIVLVGSYSTLSGFNTLRQALFSVRTPVCPGGGSRERRAANQNQYLYIDGEGKNTIMMKRKANGAPAPFGIYVSRRQSLGKAC